MSTTTLHTTFIYGLCDPETGEIRYVGKSKNVEKRIREHLRPCALLANTHKIFWIKSLLARRLIPIFKILLVVPASIADAEEIKLIATMRASGARLTNTADGGEGGHVGKEAHLKQAAALRGRKVIRSPEHNAKIVACNRARATDPAWRAKISKRATDRVKTERPRLMEQLKVAWFAPRTKRYECVCLGCGSEFIAKNTRKKYCRPQCAINAWKRRDRKVRAGVPA